MISQSLAHLGIAELQKAVLGMNPAIKPYAALAALQEKVKSEQMRQSQAMQNPAQPPVAQQMMAQAQQLTPAQINNPYMASGLGAAPVQSPVQAPTASMASGGIIAFDEGGEIPRFQVGGAMAERERERERVLRLWQFIKVISVVVLYSSVISVVVLYSSNCCFICSTNGINI